jgi:predicted protein tyrosine phosphatase
MNIQIAWLMNACDYRPDNPTYAIRIWRPGNEVFLLASSELWVWQDNYFFDDTWPEDRFRQKEGLQLITDEDAALIVRNFQRVKERVETLLVHCSRWVNRSPAVAIALAEWFWLRNPAEVDELKKVYKDATWYVYRKVLWAIQQEIH